MNIYAFLLKVNGKFSKIRKIALKTIDFAQKRQETRLKVRKKAPRNAKMAQLASKMSSGVSE